jgi:MYXO-CTERM domain-containing protein
MSTPDDGLPPRMQVFLWGGKETRSLTAGARTPGTGTAAFGPTSFDVTGDIVLANDGVDTGSDACTALSGSLAGKIVLVDRGACTFKTKTLNVQNAGGVGVIIGDNVAGTAPPGLADDALITTPITVPTLSILQSDATQLKTDIAGGPVVTKMKRDVGVELEGTLDASVIAHEFGHYVHHRLSLCSTAACGAMSEGWGDFSALLVVAREGDNLMGAYPMGIYSTQSFSSDPAYYGIRRAPYSADHTINDLSFRHMTNGAATPTTHPFLVMGANSEVHNAGEIWAAMMWEGYVALQQAGTSFEDVRLKMRQYVVAGLLLAPPDATPTETRDAILTAARAASPEDHDILAAAYARRGFGSCAVSAPRTSSNFQGIVESNVVKGNAALGAPTMAIATTCDADSILDAGETAHVTLPIVNTGPSALTNVVATLTSPTTGVTITSQPVAIGTLDAYGTNMATFDIAVADTVTDPTAAEFSITLTANDGCTDMVQQTVAMPINTDDVLKSSATDSFDAIGTVWTMPSTESQWTHARATALDGSMFGADSGARTDSSVTSPVLTADATTPVTITFSHKFSFEFSGNTYWDGGVIEISKDGGMTWEDVSAYVTTAPYNSTLTTTSDNPLGGRAAFGKTNASYPAADTVTLDFGDKLAGQMFQIRFRVVTDGGTGGLGWEIDDVAFTGITGTPFPTLVADSGTCDGDEGSGSDTTMPDAGVPTAPDAGGNAETGDDDMGGCCQSQRSPTGSGLLAASVLGLIARRRRRRR